MSIIDKLSKGSSYRLDDHRIISSRTGDVVLTPSRDRPMRTKNDRYYHTLYKQNYDYFSEPKYLGSMDSDALEAIGWRNIDEASRVHTRSPDDRLLIAEQYDLSASAFTEAAFVKTNLTNASIDTVDERLDLIDLSDECLTLAIDAMPVQQTTLKQRLQLKLDFGRIQRDIVCGDINPESVNEIIEHLESHLLRTYDNVDAVHARGLAGEIRVMLEHWYSYRNGSAIVALPSTVRGDSGFQHRTDTHDLDLLTQGGEETWKLCTPIEVKRRKIQKWMLLRYTGSDLVYTNPARGTTTAQYATTFKNS